MKKYNVTNLVLVAIILIFLVIIIVSVVFSVLRPGIKLLGGSDYNPNYADAIQMKKPELCQDINYALQSGPTDSIDKVYGDSAIELCKSQAKAGYFGCECDSDTVLSDMRKH